MNKNIKRILLGTGIVLTSIYTANRIINYLAEFKSDEDLVTRHTMKWKYGNIAYEKYGKGKPVLLIHDLNPCSSSSEWVKVKQQLAKTHTVYALDLLGCGHSDKPNLTYTNYLYVQLITDFIKKIICEKTDVVACGDTGSFTIMACNMTPEYFKKIILVSPTALEKLTLTPTKTNNIMKYIMDMPLIGTLLYNLKYSYRNIETTFVNDYFYDETKASIRFIKNYYANAHLGDSNGKYLAASILSNYTNINIVFALKNVNNSIYIIEGEENENAEDIVDTYISYNPSIEAAYIKDSAHLLHLEKTNDFMNNLKLFLES